MEPYDYNSGNDNQKAWQRVARAAVATVLLVLVGLVAVAVRTGFQNRAFAQAREQACFSVQGTLVSVNGRIGCYHLYLIQHGASNDGRTPFSLSDR